jgi:succinate-semialdehyde dehydrogenase / glutarate-semialdehyde dehydrogenase
MEFKSINPYNGRVLKTYQGTSQKEIEQHIEKAFKAYIHWRSTGFETRINLIKSVAAELRKGKDTYAGEITREMGKPIKEAAGEIEKCAALCDYYADNAAEFLADTPLNTPHGTGYIHYNPLGVVLAVMPWNFPFWQVFRFAVPAILAGNACLLKHASNVPGCAVDIEQIFLKAGLPEGLFTTLLIGSKQVQSVIEHKSVVAVTLTGSEAAGQSVASAAGKNLKKTVLELGGSDAYIVLKDADVAEAAKTGVKARMLNTGQSCIAAKRFILEKGIASEFTQKFIEELKSLKNGNPADPETDYGTLARQDLAEEVWGQVKESIDSGARILYGELPEKITSAYFPPMILSNLKPGMPAYDQEVFGPVASFFTVENEEEAISLANDSQYGLGGSLWTNNTEKAKVLADKIESGAVYINQMMFSDGAVPFGGIKKSGYGRELSYLGIREFTNQKTVWIK